jgi:hypothetical protein
MNFNKPFKNLKNEVMTGMTQGQMLAEYLTQISKGNSIKLIAWSLKLYANEPVELDQTDVDVIKGLVETSETVPNLYKAQILFTLAEK